MTGMGRTYVVSAGDTTVTPIEYRLAYDRQVAVLSQQFGRAVTREQAKAFGIEDMVLGQMVAGALLDEQASELGLGLSEDRLAALTMEDPAFKGPDSGWGELTHDFTPISQTDGWLGSALLPGGDMR